MKLEVGRGNSRGRGTKRGFVHCGKSDALEHQIGKEEIGIFTPKREKNCGDDEQTEQKLDEGTENKGGGLAGQRATVGHTAVDTVPEDGRGGSGGEGGGAGASRRKEVPTELPKLEQNCNAQSTRDDTYTRLVGGVRAMNEQGLTVEWLCPQQHR